MTGLSRSIDRIKDSYDVIVVGSGYGGGVAASRLARAGKRVAVLERGREVLTGGFPSRFPDLKNELQVTGKRVRTGPSSGALRRAPRRGHARARRLRARRRFADQCGRGAAARRSRVRGRDLAGPDCAGWPARGRVPPCASAGCSPQSDPRAAAHTKFKALAAAGSGARPHAHRAPRHGQPSMRWSIARASPNPPARAAATAAEAAMSAPRTPSR